MASLKDILPLLLAGTAGAVSPRGADVFQNIYRMDTVRKEGERRDKDSAARLKLAERTAERMDKADKRSEESQKQIISLREMSLKRGEREDKQRQEDRESFDAYKEATYGDGGFSDEEVVTLSQLTNRTDFDATVRKMNKLTLKEMIDLKNEAEAGGAGVSVSDTGSVSVRSQAKRAGDVKPTRAERFNQATEMFEDSVEDLDDSKLDAAEADKKIRALGSQLTMLGRNPEMEEERQAIKDEMNDLAKERYRSDRAFQVGMAKLRRQITNVGGSEMANEMLAGFSGDGQVNQLPPVETEDDVVDPVEAHFRATHGDGLTTR